jgi:molybdate/tungstate transport system ATP-binding protein
MIRTKELVFEIGEFRLGAISVEIPRNEYFVLLGPPGSGKSIFLECLCGLRQVKSGSVLLDGSDVTAAEPRTRNIGYVPQDYALFPHLTVEGNIGFGLKTQSVNREEIRHRINSTAEMLGISHLLKRGVAGLSGGEKQRTALARALVTQPKVLLLDEPVCALDEATRQSICSMLHSIQRRLQLTVVHVSHNIEEAFSVADCAAIIDKGALQQVGRLEELLRRPRTEFVGRFMRCENVISADVVRADPQNNSTEVDVAGLRLVVNGLHEGSIKMTIRPEDLMIACRSVCGEDADNRIDVQMRKWRDFGSFVKVHFEGPIDLVGHLPHAVFDRIKPDDPNGLGIILQRKSIHVLES